MDIIAYTKFIRMSPRKLRLVAKHVKSLGPDEASSKLPFLEKRAALPILKTLNSAIANAINNHKIEQKNLRIKNILIEEGARVKRMDKSHGARFNRGILQKRMSHIKVILTDGVNYGTKN